VTRGVGVGGGGGGVRGVAAESDGKTTTTTKMKLVHQAFVRDGAGSVKLVPEDSEDMWHAYNLVREGDRVSATTMRKVVKEGGGGGGADVGGLGGGGSSGSAVRVRVKLEVKVEGIEFDPEGAC
jgi:protein pelota